MVQFGRKHFGYGRESIVKNRNTDTYITTLNVQLNAMDTTVHSITISLQKNEKRRSNGKETKPKTQQQPKPAQPFSLSLSSPLGPGKTARPSHFLSPLRPTLRSPRRLLPARPDSANSPPARPSSPRAGLLAPARRPRSARATRFAR